MEDVPHLSAGKQIEIFNSPDGGRNLALPPERRLAAGLGRD
jgi:hypothetical protein